MTALLRVGRTVPPAAAPVGVLPLLRAFVGLFATERYRSAVEREMRDYFGVEHVYLVSSGKAALFIILRALKSLSPERDEVLIPAYTCYSVPSAIVKAGLKVKLCDIDLRTFDYNADLLAAAVTERTLCVVTGNLLGIPSDFEKVKRLCERRRAFVVEDAAQAMGVEVDGRKVGTAGDVGFFSFGRGKNVTCGGSGAVVTRSERLAGALQREYGALREESIPAVAADFAKLVMLAVFIKPNLYWFPSMLPFLKLGETVFHKDFPVRRMSGMSAAALTGWRSRLATSNRARERNAELVMEELPRWRRRLSPLLRLPLLADTPAQRDRICALTARHGLGISTLYPAPIHHVPEVRGQFPGASYPASEAAAERLACIPTHELLTDEDRRAVIRAVKEVLGEEGGRLAGAEAGTTAERRRGPA
jgi:dTDP-4-amino-4,6-dideoxygalactose transaminase